MVSLSCRALGFYSKASAAISSNHSFVSSPSQRNIEIARRQAVKEQKKKEKEESGKKPGLLEPEPKEEEEELPPIYIPDEPSPLCCGFYSQPSQFWLSMVRVLTEQDSQTPRGKH